MNSNRSSSRCTSQDRLASLLPFRLLGQRVGKFPVHDGQFRADPDESSEDLMDTQAVAGSFLMLEMLSALVGTVQRGVRGAPIVSVKHLEFVISCYLPQCFSSFVAGLRVLIPRSTRAHNIVVGAQGAIMQ